MFKAYEQIHGFKFVVGEQQLPATMDKALELAGGSFGAQSTAPRLPLLVCWPRIIDSPGFCDVPFPPDVIIDDGAHHNSINAGCFKYLFKHVAPGGVYIIEDLNTAYAPGQAGGLRAKNSW